MRLTSAVSEISARPGERKFLLAPALGGLVIALGHDPVPLQKVPATNEHH
jgi:hypothetical protein